MRPLQLTMAAFGPYAGTETVDFDALSDLGLFVVAGNNGAGKTTIFDALHYALYGTMPGRRASYIRLKSDHARLEDECKVTLDFAARSQHWRVERTPKQKRRKKRGDGTRVTEGRATLYRLDNDQPVAVANKLGEVTAMCTELVGLSGKQFERVALLPQGEFSRVLLETGTSRRDLLRTLFSSDVFDRATGLLVEQSRAASERVQAELAALSDRRTQLAAEVSELVGSAVPEEPATLLDALQSFRTNHITVLAATAATQAAASQAAAGAHAEAQEAERQITRRNELRRQLAAHEQTADAQEARVAELETARSAVPVMSASDSLDDQTERRDQAQNHTARLFAALNDELGQCQLTIAPTPTEAEITAVADQLHSITENFKEQSRHREALATTERALASLSAERRRAVGRLEGLLDRSRGIQGQLANLQQTLRSRADEPSLAELREFSQAAARRRDLRHEMSEVASKADRMTHQLAELTQQATALTASHATAQAAAAGDRQRYAEAQSAIEALVALEQRQQAAATLFEATETLNGLRRNHRDLQGLADDLWRRYVHSAAPRLAALLADGEPCPVCGSCDHPASAAGEADDPVDHDQVESARTRAEAVRHQVVAIERQVAELIEHDPLLGDTEPDTLQTEIADAKLRALQADRNAEENHRQAIELPQLDAALSKVVADRQQLELSQQQVDARLSELRRELGDGFDGPVDALIAEAEAAARRVEQAEHAEADATQMASRVEKLEQQLGALERSQLTAESELKGVEGQLAGERKRREQLRAERGEGADVTIVEEVALAAERAAKLVGSLRSASAVLQESVEAHRRATALLRRRLDESSFGELSAAHAAVRSPDQIRDLERTVTQWSASNNELIGMLRELADLPDRAPDTTATASAASQAQASFEHAQRALVQTEADVERFERDLTTIVSRTREIMANDGDTLALARVAGLVKGDNDRNTSLENWVLAAHLRDVVDQANLRLARSTQQRFQLCVLDDGENRRGVWGLDLAVEDTVTGTRRATAGLSGGELFQASLALALGLADVVMADSAGVRIDALFIDEGFGSLDEVSVERAIDLLDELRGRGTMVGVITHVPALLDALPRGITVHARPDGAGSTLEQQSLAA